MLYLTSPECFEFIDNSLLRHLTIKYKKLDTETEYFKERNGSEKKK